MYNIVVLIHQYHNVVHKKRYTERLIYMGLCYCCKKKKKNTYYNFVPCCLSCFARLLRAGRHYANLKKEAHP